MTDVQEIVAALRGKKAGENSWLCHCPAHDDSEPSLSVSIGESGKTLFHCHTGCTQEAVMAELEGMGLWNKKTSIPKPAEKPAKKPAKIVKTYDYINVSGELVYQVCRLEPKSFRQRRPDGNGKWIWNLRDVNRILYHLPDVVTANTIFICEGEKDADAINALGLVGTTNAGGASNWIPEYSKCLEGKNCIILPDNDKAGYKHAMKISSTLTRYAKSIKIINLPDVPSKGDISDWFEMGNNKDDLLKLVNETEEYEPRKESDETTDQPTSRDQEIVELYEAYVAEGYRDQDAITLITAWSITSPPRLTKTQIRSIIKNLHQHEQDVDLENMAKVVKKIVIVKYPDGNVKYNLYLDDTVYTTVTIKELMSSKLTIEKIAEATRLVFKPQKQDKWLDLVGAWLKDAEEQEVAIEESELGIVKEIMLEWMTQWEKQKDSEHANTLITLKNNCVVEKGTVYFILTHLEEDIRFHGVKISRTLLCEFLHRLGARATEQRKYFDGSRVRTWEIPEKTLI